MPAPIQPTRASAVVRRSERTRFLFASDDRIGGLDGAIRVRDVSAADLQEKPTKPVEAELGIATVASSDSTNTAAAPRPSQRAKRATGPASLASEAIKNDHDTPSGDDPKVRDRSSGDTMDATEQVQQSPSSPTSQISGRVQRDRRGREV
jgi:hypothetical protein